jgi:hypothetical protein
VNDVDAEHLEADAAEPTEPGLWPGDTGTLRHASRRTLVALIRGPYISAKKHSELWRALVTDQSEIRSRLADIFLELVVDDVGGLAFVRNFAAENVPQVVRTHSLTFIDTVLLLHLRDELVRASGSAIVGRDEVIDQLKSYQKAASTDPAGFSRRIATAWTKFEKLSILIPLGVDDRYEVSGILRLIFTPEEIEAIKAEYARILGGEPLSQTTLDNDEDGDEEL